MVGDWPDAQVQISLDLNLAHSGSQPLFPLTHFMALCVLLLTDTFVSLPAHVCVPFFTKSTLAISPGMTNLVDTEPPCKRDTLPHTVRPMTVAATSGVICTGSELQRWKVAAVFKLARLSPSRLKTSCCKRQVEPLAALTTRKLGTHGCGIVLLEASTQPSQTPSRHVRTLHTPARQQRSEGSHRVGGVRRVHVLLEEKQRILATVGDESLSLRVHTAKSLR